MYILVGGMTVSKTRQREPTKKLTHTVVISSDKHRAARAWCFEKFGSNWDVMDNRQGNWVVFWAGPKRFNEYEFSFFDEKDATWFALRWI